MTTPLSPALRDRFAHVARELEQFRWRDDVEVTSIPSPQRIAPWSVAIEAEVLDGADNAGTGRLVLLGDSEPNEGWCGTLRCVTFARAEVGEEMVADPLFAEVAWSWLTEALDRQGARHLAASGTVTAVASRAFGALEDQEDSAEVEIRASWTPVLGEGGAITPHLAAWQELLCRTAGLPEVPEGVVLLESRMGRGR